MSDEWPAYAEELLLLFANRAKEKDPYIAARLLEHIDSERMHELVIEAMTRVAMDHFDEFLKTLGDLMATEAGG